jgi:hypothetical protein
VKQFFEYEMEINMTQAQQPKRALKNQAYISTGKLNDARMVMKPIVVAMATLCFGVTLSSANAGERESLEQLRSTTVNLVNLLVEEGVLSKGKAEQLLKQAEQDAQKAKEIDATTTPASTAESIDATIDKKMVRIQYVPEIVKKQMKEDIKDEVMTSLNYKAGERLGMPEWIDRLKWEGSLRLRAESDKFPGGNPIAENFNIANGTNLNNTTEDRNRLRVRAQLGVKAEINDWMTAGIRMTTGSLNDPISPNQTQEAASAKYTLGLDRAYLSAVVTPWANVVGGRFENPFFSTDLMWDPDLAFDGIVASFTSKINDSWSGFATLGAFPLKDVEGSDTNKANSKWLYGSQVGIKWTSANRSSVKLGAALYEFDNVEGITNGLEGGNLRPPYDATVPVYRTKGNSVFDINNSTRGNPGYVEKFGLLSKFRNINITGQVDLATFDPVHIILTGDYVRNIGYDEKEINQRIGSSGINDFGFAKKQVNAYQVKLAVGMPTTYKAHDWQAFAAYKRLEADAVLDAYTDSDFYLGGTNAKGWIIGASYGVGENAWLAARWFSADEIRPRVASGVPLSIDVLMLDLNTKF